jgi:YegS/Rv2252/BmrU family lipid kinase
MQKRKVKLIVNPNADLGRAWHKASNLRPIVQEFGGADWAGTVYPTHATELAKQAALDGYDLIISAGGDGTTHEVINGLMQVPKEQRPQIGIVPLGSGNDFAFAVGMNPEPEYAIRQIFTGNPKWVDVGKVEDNRGRVEYWDNALGIGFDAIVTIRSRRFTAFSGFLIYLLAVMQTIILNGRAPHFEIKTEHNSWSDQLLLFILCNGNREGGGFHVYPPARVNDGVFNYVGIPQVSRPMMLRLLPEVMRGTHLQFSLTRKGEFTQMEIQADQNLVIHTDGEIFSGFGMDVHSLKVNLIPSAIQVVS